jgi:hypothetical protein
LGERLEVVKGGYSATYNDPERAQEPESEREDWLTSKSLAVFAKVWAKGQHSRRIIVKVYNFGHEWDRVVFESRVDELVVLRGNVVVVLWVDVRERTTAWGFFADIVDSRVLLIDLLGLGLQLWVGLQVILDGAMLIRGHAGRVLLARASELKDQKGGVTTKWPATELYAPTALT